MALHLSKLESPPPKDALCQVWLKLDSSSEEDYQILPFHYYLPLDRGDALHFNKFESPSPKDALC